MPSINSLKSTIVLVTFLCLQSCYMYKPVTVDQIKIGKYYKMKVADGRTVENKCIAITDSSVIFKARTVELDFKKNDIEFIKRRKTSPMIYLAGAAATTAAILSVTTNKKGSFFEETRPK